MFTQITRCRYCFIIITIIRISMRRTAKKYLLCCLICNAFLILLEKMADTYTSVIHDSTNTITKFM